MQAGTAPELRRQTGTRRRSLSLANLQLVPRVARLPCLLSLASLPLPRNGTCPKDVSSAPDVRRAGLTALETRGLARWSVACELAGASHGLCRSVNDACRGLGVAPRAVAEPALRRDAPPTPPAAGACHHQRLQLPSSGRAASAAAVCVSSRCILCRSSIGAVPGREQPACFLTETNPTSSWAACDCYHRLTGLLRVFRERLDEASGGNTAG